MPRILLTDTQIYMLRSLCGFSGKCRNKDGSLTPDTGWERSAFEKLASLGFANYNSIDDSYTVTETGKTKYEKYDDGYRADYP